MSGEATFGHGPRARPVADAPIEGLLARADDLAKRWVLALAGACALADIADLPLAQIVRVAPSLCARVLSALRSDDALASEPVLDVADSARPEGPLGLDWDGEPQALVAAVEALRMVLWDALASAASAASFRASDDRLIRDLADRLAYVCSVVLARSLPGETSPRASGLSVGAETAAARQMPPWSAPAFSGDPTGVQRTESGDPARGRAAHRAEPVVGSAPSLRASGFSSRPSDHAPPAEQAPPTQGGAARQRAVLVDEFVPPPRRARARARATGREGMREAERDLRRAGGAEGRALPWDIPLTREGRATESSMRSDSPPGPVPQPPAAEGSEISVLRRRPPRERE